MSADQLRVHFEFEHGRINDTTHIVLKLRKIPNWVFKLGKTIQ